MLMDSWRHLWGRLNNNFCWLFLSRAATFLFMLLLGCLYTTNNCCLSDFYWAEHELGKALTEAEEAHGGDFSILFFLPKHLSLNLIMVY